MDASDLISRMFEHSNCVDAGVSEEIFAKHLDGWQLHELDRNGEIVGAAAQRGPEIHVIYFGRPCGSIRKHLTRHLQRIIDEFGFAETYVEFGNERSRIFCERLGFRRIATVGGADLMSCTALSYARKQ